ncbi:MAG: hypothetical protein LBV80_00535 [Deltaproteobacteria bacterium]|jgi:hypothetical protein|nr:hypothetical protein [Deltaproteobacteria bacterium]
MIISTERLAEWRSLAQECAEGNIACYPTTPKEFLSLLDALEVAEARNTTPCPHCDFSSGQRGMDRCSHCDGTGRVSVMPYLEQERNEQKARAEQAERERDALAMQLCLSDPPCVSIEWKCKFILGDEAPFDCVYGGTSPQCWLLWARQQAQEVEK